jgi:DNA-binding XRE family transcriptional regulator
MGLVVVVSVVLFLAFALKICRLTHSLSSISYNIYKISIFPLIMNELEILLKTARKAQQLSQLELQDLSDVSASVIYKLENGRTDVTLGSFLAVANALGVKLKIRRGSKDP